MFYELEIKWINFLQSYRTIFLDNFFLSLNYFDTLPFYLIFISIVWIERGRQLGIKLVYLFLISQLVGHSLKEYFTLPRPFHLDPSVGVILVKGYGFPSGAAQGAILIAGMILAHLQSHWKWTVACSYIFFISFSRVYLGVHFFSDILGGWILGFTLLYCFLHASLLVENRMKDMSAQQLLIISQVVPLSILIGFYSSTSMFVCALAMGAGCGVWLSQLRQLHFDSFQSLRKLALSLLICILGFYLSNGLIELFKLPNSHLSLFIRGIFIGFWISYGAPLAYTKLCLKPYVFDVKSIDQAEV